MILNTDHLEISGITRIVINRISKWCREPSCDEHHPLVWRKYAGGPGFDFDKVAGERSATKTPEEMKRLVDRLLSKQVTKCKWQGVDVVTEQYRAWVHGNTLNIVQRNLKGGVREMIGKYCQLSHICKINRPLGCHFTIFDDGHDTEWLWVRNPKCTMPEEIILSNLEVDE